MAPPAGSMILQVVTDTDRRGAQVFATDLHDALARAGRDVKTVALTEGVVGGLDLPVLGPSRRHRGTLAALAREARRSDIVIAHGSTTLPLSAIVGPLTRTPFVYRQISDSLFWASDRRRLLQTKVALGRASAVVALWPGSSRILQSVFGVPERNIEVIPNGVPPARFEPIDRAETPAARRKVGLDPDRSTVLSIGALVDEKGVDLAIEAVAGLDDVQLLVAGDGPERVALEALAGRAAPDRIRFVGSLADPQLAFTAADVVVLPSRGGDSMPAVLIEAGLMGLPSVATPIEGIVDIVVPDRTGKLVPVESVADLRDAIRSIVSDRSLATTLGEGARRHCLDHFAIDVVGASWARVIDRVLA